MIPTVNVGLKPSKVRWLQKDYKFADDTNYIFVSSYEEGTRNAICPISIIYDEKEGKIQSHKKLKPLTTCAGVTDIEQLTESTLLWTCSDGSLSLGCFSTAAADEEILSSNTTTNPFSSSAIQPQSIKPAALTLSLSKHRREAVIGYENGDLHTVAIGEASLTNKSKVHFGAAISASAFRDMNTLALGCLGDVFLWDVRSSSLLDAKTLDNKGTGDQDVMCIDAHPASSFIVVCGKEDGTVLSWDTRTMKLLDCVKMHKSNVWDVRFNRRHPQYLATCSEDGTGCLFNTDTKKEMRMNHFCSPVNSIDLHEDYNIVASVTETGELSFVHCDL